MAPALVSRASEDGHRNGQEYSRLDGGHEASRCDRCSACPLGRKSVVGLGAVLLAVALICSFGGVVDRVGAASFTSASPGCVVNVIIARHCDKHPPWESDATPQELCTFHGLLRGENMARIFAKGGRFPVPSQLYARHMPEDVYSSRDLYLLWPLAQRYGLLVNTTFEAHHVLQLASALLAQRSQLCGQTVVIAWDHCAIPALTQALGCVDDACVTCWDDSDYDRIIWLRYTALPDGSWDLAARAEKEGYGKSKHEEGYRECIGNPVENGAFGFKCTRLHSWPPDLVVP